MIASRAGPKKTKACCEQQAFDKSGLTIKGCSHIGLRYMPPPCIVNNLIHFYYDFLIIHSFS
jgi:hypothetical protein